MRIMFVTNTFPPGYTGGAEVSTVHTCRGLIQRGVDCSVLVLNNRFPEIRDEWYEYEGIPVHCVFYSTPRRTALTDVWDLRIYRWLHAELRRLQPDLVHIHNVSGGTLASYTACRSLGIPVVNTLHDLWLLCPNNMLYCSVGRFCDPRQHPHGCRHCFRRYDFWGNIPYRRRIFAALTSNVRYFISPSWALIQRHVEAGYAPERFLLVRLGFAPFALRNPGERAAAEQLAAQVGKGPVIAFVGGGVEVKGAAVILQAIPKLLERVPDAQILIAGGGEEYFLEQFRRYAPKVQVLGVLLPAVAQALFAIADLVLVPSVLHENSPVVIYQSFQVGTPVIGSDFGGIPELIRVGETGYLFPTGNTAALVERITAHLNRPAVERRHMRLRCVAEAREHLGLEYHLDKLLSVYQEVLEA